jgi:hypothetical protein
MDAIQNTEARNPEGLAGSPDADFATCEQLLAVLRNPSGFLALVFPAVTPSVNP